MSAVDLKKLPKISFANTDSGSVESAILRDYENRTSTTLYPGDPVRLFLESVAWEAFVQNSVIDLAAKQNLLAYASGANLDHIGALMGVARIPAQSSRTSIRFSLAAPLGFTVLVPKGGRVGTRDGKAIFATLIEAEISPGKMSVDVAAMCLQAGSAGSGLLPGQIECMIDPLPYIAAISNISTTADGADVESDEHLRERIRLAPESFTVAGSSGEYEARTLAVSAEITEVSVTSPEPGVVDVRFVLEDGALPDDVMCALVSDALNAETVRPLTDRVIVGAPVPVEYTIRGTWQVRRSDAPMLSAIMANVESALGEYLRWQRARPGRDIVPSRLVELVQSAGAKRVQIDEPAFTRLSASQIAREVNVELLFGGLEEE